MGCAVWNTVSLCGEYDGSIPGAFEPDNSLSYWLSTCPTPELRIWFHFGTWIRPARPRRRSCRCRVHTQMRTHETSGPNSPGRFQWVASTCPRTTGGVSEVSGVLHFASEERLPVRRSISELEAGGESGREWRGGYHSVFSAGAALQQRFESIRVQGVLQKNWSRRILILFRATVKNKSNQVIFFS